MRRAAFVLALGGLLVIAGGCTSRYTVHPDDLSQARRRAAADAAGEVVVAARDPNGRVTALELRAIRSARPVGDRLSVEVSDARPALRISGWATFAIGALAFGIGSIVFEQPPGRQSEVLALLHYLGLGVLSSSGALLGLGYDRGPERPLPAPVAAPPERLGLR